MNPPVVHRVMLVVLGILAALVALPGSLRGQQPFDVVSIRPEGGPELRVREQPGPLMALRLSAPVDPAIPWGAVELVQELARPGAEERARRFGARLSFRHEGGVAVVMVTGPTAAFDALAALLRSVTTELDLSAGAVAAARARAESRVLAKLEQPEPRVRELLRRALLGVSPPVGAASSVLEPEEIRRLAERLYRPTVIRITVVGSVPDALLRSAFSAWPAAPPGLGTAVVRPDSAGEAARPQAHREWAGIGYLLDAGVDAEVAVVAAALIQRRMDRSALQFGATHAWSVPSGWALALVGATEPGDSVVRATAGVGVAALSGDAAGQTDTDVGRYLRRMIAEAVALVGEGAVADARTALRRRLLMEARTVTGQAELIGRLTDALGDRTPADFFEGLDSVGVDDVRSLLQGVLLEDPVYVEAR